MCEIDWKWIGQQQWEESKEAFPPMEREYTNWHVWQKAGKEQKDDTHSLSSIISWSAPKKRSPIIEQRVARFVGYAALFFYPSDKSTNCMLLLLSSSKRYFQLSSLVACAVTSNRDWMNLSINEDSDEWVGNLLLCQRVAQAIVSTEANFET